METTSNYLSLEEKKHILTGWFETWKNLCDQTGNKLNVTGIGMFGHGPFCYSVSNGVKNISITKFTDKIFSIIIADRSFRINADAGNKFISYFNERRDIRNKEYDEKMDFTAVEL